MFYRFSVDDNIIFLKDLNFHDYGSVFENEYLSFFKNLHEKYGTKVQFNLFYKWEDFNLSQMTDKYKSEFIKNSEWLQFSFHSSEEFEKIPYNRAAAAHISRDCTKVNKEIIRFAGKECLNYYTTVHMVDCGKNACRTLRKNNGILGLVGLFGTKESSGKSYYLENLGKYFDTNWFYYDKDTDLYFFNNSLILNLEKLEEIPYKTEGLKGRYFIEIMIHEQYYYPSYTGYQFDFKDKVNAAISKLTFLGYKPVFLNELTDKILYSKKPSK